MLVVEVIKLNRILDLFMTVSWHLMLHIETSNWFMDWQKYPKSKMSIRIWQHETLDSVKCHTFPGLRSKTLDILLHYFHFFFCAKGFNWDTGPHKQFYCDTSPVCACTSPPVWLAYFQVNLTPGQTLFRANIAELSWRASGPPILPQRLVRAQQDTLSLCQLPPFKLRALSPPRPSGRSTAATSAPDQRLEGCPGPVLRRQSRL